MLYKETVSKEMLILLEQLMKDTMLGEFNLVGGTALSLQIGHRLSIDIDLFSIRPFDSQKMKEYLVKNYGAVERHIFKNAVLMEINGIKIDCITHQYPWQHEIKNIEGIRLASLQDIGAMKLNAIMRSGERIKDFIDMYFLLEYHPLQTYLNTYENKYDTNRFLASTALLYHEQVDMHQKISLLNNRDNNWATVRDRLKKAVLLPDKKFEYIPKIKTDLPKQKRRGFRL
ncbi:nucleotidyl transferase AbiEii/AbiGii toxin family protein [Chryseobacterium sp.]|uniref:nucleotidyl transferase AbiEii/AbiGii toxin family protein n=1 Tax=Chryseobacterium sp. TaxID=1871047 RepID=UPI0033404AFF